MQAQRISTARARSAESVAASGYEVKASVEACKQTYREMREREEAKAYAQSQSARAAVLEGIAQARGRWSEVCDGMGSVTRQHVAGWRAERERDERRYMQRAHAAWRDAERSREGARSARERHAEQRHAEAEAIRAKSRAALHVPKFEAEAERRRQLHEKVAKAKRVPPHLAQALVNSWIS